MKDAHSIFFQNNFLRFFLRFLIAVNNADFSGSYLDYLFMIFHKAQESVVVSYLSR